MSAFARRGPAPQKTPRSGRGWLPSDAAHAEADADVSRRVSFGPAGTGFLERKEVKRLLVEFNIVSVRDAAIETLIDFADFDGDGEINYAEFARILTADDVMKMVDVMKRVET